MSLTPDQKIAVVSWVAAGDNLSAVQKKLMEQFQISLTYRDVRFLVDDLDLQLKDAAPKVDTSDVSKTPPPPEAPASRQAAAGKNGPAAAELAGADDADADLPGDAGLAPEGEEAFDDLPPEGGASNVSVAVDKLTLIPGAMASGTVTFSDGVTAKWIVDQYGRPGFTEVSKPGYRPTPADGQAFMQELSSALQKRGF